jgi:hypothetical protein
LESPGSLLVYGYLRDADYQFGGGSGPLDLKFCGSPPTAGGAGTQAFPAFFMQALPG